MKKKLKFRDFQTNANKFRLQNLSKKWLVAVPLFIFLLAIPIYNVLENNTQVEAWRTSVDFIYTGSVQEWEVPITGSYKLEAWGAGYGGYSTGAVNLTQGEKLYIYAGGAPGQDYAEQGGFNGGGGAKVYGWIYSGSYMEPCDPMDDACMGGGWTDSSYYGYCNIYGGYGASDVRIGVDSLYSRVIVAGGSGGDGTSSDGWEAQNAGGGGGLTGGGHSSSGGTQTNGGLGAVSGGFGVGGTADPGILGDAVSTGGGGGWFGGSANYGNCGDYSPENPEYWITLGGGGGSGWVFTEDNYNAGLTDPSNIGGTWLLGSQYYLADADTIDSTNANSIAAPANTISGTGAVRITWSPSPVTVDSISPDNGLRTRETEVTINGVGFYSGIDVKISNSTCQTVNVISEFQLTCTVWTSPAAGTVDVQVGDYILKNAFTFRDPVTITGIVPTSGPATGGTQVVITGTNFRDATDSLSRRETISNLSSMNRKTSQIYKGKLYLPSSGGNTMDVYDLADGTKTTKSLGYYSVDRNTSQVYNGMLYLPSSNYMGIFDLENNTYSTGGLVNPAYTTFETSQIYDGKLYLPGGNGNSMVIYDMLVNSSTYIDNLTSMTRKTSQIYDGKLYLPAASGTVMDIYDLSDGTVTQVTNLTDATRSTSQVYDGKLYLPRSGDGTEVDSYMDIYDFETGAIQTVQYYNAFNRAIDTSIVYENRLYMAQSGGDGYSLYAVADDSLYDAKYDPLYSLSQGDRVGSVGLLNTNRYTAQTYNGKLYLPAANGTSMDIIDLAAGNYWNYTPATMVSIGSDYHSFDSLGHGYNESWCVDVEIISSTEIHCTTTANSAGSTRVKIDERWDGAGSEAYLLDAFTFIGDVAPYINLDLSSSDLSITDGTTLNTQITPSTSGKLGYASNTISVRTNMPGYNLSISTSTTDNDMHHMSLNETLPSITGADIANPSKITTNHWGFTTSDITNSPDGEQNQWLTMPDSTNPLTVKSTTTPNETLNGDQTTITYAAKINTQQLAGTYQTTVVYTVIGNEPPVDPYSITEFTIQIEEAGLLKLGNKWPGGSLYSLNGSAYTLVTYDEEIPVVSGDIVTVKEVALGVSFRSWRDDYTPFVRGVAARIISMPTMDKFTTDEAGAIAGNYFFKGFNNSEGTLVSLPAGSFDTSNITSTGRDFFAGFNRSNYGAITSLPAGSFNTSSIVSVGNSFFFAFNASGSLVSLPVGSFDTSNITTTGNGFFELFNSSGHLACDNGSGVSIKNVHGSYIDFQCYSGTPLSSLRVTAGNSFQYFVSD